MSRGAIAVAVLLIGCPSSVLAQGVLQRLRHEVHDHPSSPPPPPSKPPDKESDSWASGAAGAGEALVYGAAVVAGAPFVVPMLALGDQTSTAAYFPIYPYPLGHPGYMRFDPWIGDDPDAPNPEGPKP